MGNKLIIINLLNKLSNEQKLSWRLNSLNAKGQNKGVLEIKIFTLPSQRQKGQITFHAHSGKVLKAKYNDFPNSTAENIVDMLLDVINFEKHRKKAGSTDSLC